MSLADGFATGFGLIQGAKQNNDKMRLERERLAETRRQADLTQAVQMRNLDVKDRLAKIEEKLSNPQAQYISSQANRNNALTEGIIFDNQMDRQFAPREREVGIGLTQSRTGLNNANRQLAFSRAGLTDYQAEGARLKNEIERATGMSLRNAEIEDILANSGLTRQNTALAGARTRGVNIENDVQEMTALDRALAEIAGMDASTYLRRTQGDGQAIENTIREATGMQDAESTIAGRRATTAKTIADTEGKVIENDIRSETGLRREEAEIDQIGAQTDSITEGTRGKKLNNNITEKYGGDQAAADLAATQEATRGSRIENDEAARDAATIAGAEAITLMDEMAEDVISGGIEPEAWQRATEASKDTIMSAGFLFNPNFDHNVKQFQKDLVEGNFETSSGVDLLNSLVKPSNKYNEGQTVTENFVNAPSVMRDGSFKVVQSGFGSVETVPDGSGVTGNILTVVQGPDGDLYPYMAPATKGRNPSERQPVVVKSEQFTPALIAAMYARDGMRASENNFKRAARIVQYGRGPEAETRFNNEVATRVTAMETRATNFPDLPSPRTGVRLGDFVNLEGGEVMRRHFEHQLLFDEEDRQDFTMEDYQRHMNAVRDSREGRLVAERVVGKNNPPLTNKELEMVQILDFSKKDNRRKYFADIIRTLKENRQEAGVGFLGGSLMVGTTDTSE